MKQVSEDKAVSLFLLLRAGLKRFIHIRRVTAIVTVLAGMSLRAGERPRKDGMKMVRNFLSYLCEYLAGQSLLYFRTQSHNVS